MAQLSATAIITQIRSFVRILEKRAPNTKRVYLKSEEKHLLNHFRIIEFRMKLISMEENSVHCHMESKQQSNDSIAKYMGMFSAKVLAHKTLFCVGNRQKNQFFFLSLQRQSRNSEEYLISIVLRLHDRNKSTDSRFFYGK